MKENGSHVEPNISVSTIYNRPYAVAPSQSNIVYATLYDGGSQGAYVYKSTDYGKTFGSNTAIGSWAAVTALGVSPADAKVVYAATYPVGSLTSNANVVRSTGGAYTKIESGLKQLNDAPVTQIIFGSRYESSKIWLSFGSVDNSGVYTLIGNKWYDRTYNLPKMPVNTLVYDPERDYLYAGTDVGVYRLKDGTTNWQEFNLGMPLLLITKLQINFTTDELVASTYGGGIWSCQLSTIIGDPGDMSIRTNIQEEEPALTPIDNPNIYLNIHPNPVTNISEIEVFGADKDAAILEIYELNGRKVKQMALNNNKAKLQNTDLPKGTYILVVKQNNNGYVNKKIVIL